MQIGMQIYLNLDKEEMIKNDPRFSAANFGFRKNYTIATTTSQKRLIFDNGLVIIKHDVYTLADLQSCYEWQLPNVGSIIEESAGRN